MVAVPWPCLSVVAPDSDAPCRGDDVAKIKMYASRNKLSTYGKISKKDMRNKPSPYGKISKLIRLTTDSTYAKIRVEQIERS
jgi:hypothetical protein